MMLRMAAGPFWTGSWDGQRTLCMRCRGVGQLTWAVTPRGVGDLVHSKNEPVRLGVSAGADDDATHGGIPVCGENYTDSG